MALRRTTTVSTLFGEFLNLKTPFNVVAPLTTCSFASTTTTAAPTATDKEEAASPIRVEGPPQIFKMENPFQSDEPSNVLEVDEMENGALVRLSLPGVGEDGFKVWAEENTVYFTGKGEKEYEGDDCGRKYGGCLQFMPDIHSAEGVKAKMKNGILSLLVPNAEGVKKHEEGKWFVD